MRQQLLFLELNEISFDYVKRYCDSGALPNFGRLLAEHGVTRTRSESQYEDLEPWIQWVTAHTGLTLKEHGVFRLGDIASRDIPQIWEILEAQGVSVGAISPMNARNRTSNPAFFIPDPWTSTAPSAPRLLVALYEAIVQAVNDNATSRLTIRSMLGLALGLVRYARPQDRARFVSLALTARGRPWRKAIFLDLLLANAFMAEVRRTRPQFATLLLNAGAHIQHHYLFSSAFYDGPHRNPPWYAPLGCDPLLEVYATYDQIIGAVRAEFPEARLVLATGLHQVPHRDLTYYWRLKEHTTFLREIGCSFSSVEPRMSRDFLITCASEQGAIQTASVLASARAADGLALFEVDNRGTDLFVTLVYPKDIQADFEYTVGERTFGGLRKKVAFVALKNGQHDGIGYLVDTSVRSGTHPAELALSELPRLVADAFDVRFPIAVAPAYDGAVQ